MNDDELFNKWFEGQFGRLPLSSNEWAQLLAYEGNVRVDAQRLAAKVEEERRIQDQYAAALQAWRVRGV